MPSTGMDAAASPAARRSRKGTKKTKSDWRRNVDIADVEEHIAEVSREHRTGGPLHLKRDDEVFFTDKSAHVEESKPPKRVVKSAKQRAREKVLHVDAVLAANPKVKEVASRKAPQRKPAEVIDPDEEETVNSADRLKSLSQRLRAKAAESAKLDRTKPQANGDLWVEAPDASALATNDFLEPARVVPVKLPRTLRIKPKTKVPAVEPAHPGASYNPTYEDHQAALAAAVLQEDQKLRDREALSKRLAEAARNNPGPAMSQEEEVRLQILGKLPMGGDDSDADGSAEGASEEGVHKGSATTAPERKTHAQRRKEKRLREEEEAEQERKAKKRRENEVFRVRTIRKELEAENAQREARLQRRQAKRAKAEESLPGRLGSRKYEEPAVEVQLTNDLAGSLRKLKPEGSVLSDRYRSMTKRGVVEPRAAVKPHRKYRLKAYTKKSHKDD